MINNFLKNLPFNPTMTNQFGFYVKRLKREQSVRRIGFGFIILSLFIQIFAVAVPTEKSAQASSNDVINGGVTSIGKLKEKTQAHPDVRALYARFGLSTDDMDTKSGVKNVTFKFKEQGSAGTRTVGRINFASTKDHNLGDFAGTTFYSRSASEWQGSSPAYYFGRHKGTDGNFYFVWVLKDCGNIAYRKADNTTTPSKPTTQPEKPKPETPKEIIPKVTCTRLTADKSLGKKSVTVRFTGQYSANLPNIVNGITFNFGDGTVVRHDGTVIDHTYTNDSLKSKTYTATMTVNSTTGDKTSTACRETIKLLPEVCDINPSIKPDDPKCGVCPYNPSLSPDDERCKPAPVCENNPLLEPDDPKCKCIDNPDIPADSPDCTTPGRMKTAQNITQRLTPQKTLTSKARAGDVIEYSLITTNTNVVAKTNITVDDYIGDILDYANLDQDSLRLQGGVYSPDKKTVTWANQTIPANGELKRVFRVTMKNPLPSTNTPSATATDFDCKMQNGYGNELSINVDCPIVKDVEALPNTGPGTTIAIAFTISVISGYFFARSRLLAKELGIIRKSYQ